MIDLVTVVFKQELPVLKLQAQSVELYCQDIGIRRIYVVVNDNDAIVSQVDTAWWGNLSNRVTVLPRSMFFTTYADNGWVSQQILKMMTAAISYNTWSIILDAKTIFVRPLLLDQLFDSDGRAKVGEFEIQSVFVPSQKIISDLFNITFKKQLGPSGVPFFAHNRTVREMIATVEQFTNIDFLTWFQEKGMVTEFMLYSGYIQYKNNNFDQLYSQSVAVRPCNICHSEVASFDRKFAEMQNPQILAVSVHRGAWEQITASQREQYKQYLISRNITRALEL